MKRHGYLFEKVIHKENIRQAIEKAAKDKRDRPEVKKALDDIPGHVDEIQRILQSKTYVHCIPILKEIKEGSSQKKRVVTVIDFFPDQIIHWCVVLVLSPIIECSAYTYSCGSMPGRGPHYGKRHVERWIKKDPRNTRHVAKLDIAKFYDSVKPKVMKTFLRTKIKDPNMLWLLDLILDSYPTGLAIGYLTSQWFSNFILQTVDYFIKQTLKIKYFIRYMDDMVLFASSKRLLHKAVRAIMEFLKGFGLRLKSNWQVFPLKCRALDFMGFRFFRNKTILRKTLMLRITRRVSRLAPRGWFLVSDALAVISYMGWIKHAHVYGVYLNRIKPYVSIGKCKEITRRFSRGEVTKYDRFAIRKLAPTS